MIDDDVFPRDEYGNLIHKKPCQTPGCSWPNWHVCLVGKPDTFPQLIESRKAKKTRGYSEEFTQEHKDNISASQKIRWAKKNAERDRKIVQYYKENNVGYKDVARHFGIGASTALKALKRAEARGELIMRKRGLVLAYDSAS